jgi:hypothetical protein
MVAIGTEEASRSVTRTVSLCIGFPGNIAVSLSL